MTHQEIVAAYAEAQRPYIEGGGPVPASAFHIRSWRYFIEVNTGCNLRCVMCAQGNRAGYQHASGVMNHQMLEQVLDKVQYENPGAIVHPYGNSEPFIHPNLPRVIEAIKRRGFRCEFATNLNYLDRLDEVLAARPDMIIVSTSGFTQEVYGKSHRGGDIERVKENMRLLADAAGKAKQRPHLAVSYHMYRDNLGPEMDQMKAYSEGLGFQFMISWARSISMENTIQYLRRMDNQPSDLLGLPAASEDFIRNADRLNVSPIKAVEIYKRFPIPKVCPMGDALTFIRHDGQVSLCACVSDRRLVLGNYLELSQTQLSDGRRGHPLCAECLRYRMNLYYHVVDPGKWNG